jgi:signal transduction histidine kinase
MPKPLRITHLLQRWQIALKQHPFHTVAAVMGLTLGLFLPQVAMNWRTYEDSVRIRQQELRLQRLSDRATYLDEVLTMSALMNSATGDRSWEKRYHQFVPELDQVIQESMQLVPKLYTSDDAQQIDVANQALIALEARSFNLVAKNQQPMAIALLSSQDYKTHKVTYAAGVAQRNLRIRQQLQAESDSYTSALKWSWATMAGSIALLIPAWLVVLSILRLYLQDRAIAESTLHQKNRELTEANHNLHQAQRSMQAEKLSSLGQMVAGIAHEINNPVSFISGNLTHVEWYARELLKLNRLYQEHIPDPPAIIQKEMANIELEFLTQDLPKLLYSMHLGTQRIKELVVGLRTFACLDESERKTVDIHLGLESAILLIQHQFSATCDRPAIQLVRDYSELPTIECCPGQLNQVFYSILSNAVDAIREANPATPIIRIQTDLIDAQWVRITIEDNGIGISPTVQAKMFDPFFTTKSVGQGKGLGLSISFQAVTEYHRGKLYCSSHPQKGTQFFVEIPLQTSSHID